MVKEALPIHVLLEGRTKPAYVGIIEQLHALCKEHEQSLKDVHDLLLQLKADPSKLERLRVSDDGWRLMETSPNGHIDAVAEQVRESLAKEEAKSA